MTRLGFFVAIFGVIAGVLAWALMFWLFGAHSVFGVIFAVTVGVGALCVVGGFVSAATGGR